MPILTNWLVILAWHCYARFLFSSSSLIMILNIADLPWYKHQTGEGALTHEPEIGGIRERRMVTPYHVYMLQILADVVDVAADASGDVVSAWLTQFKHGPELLELSERLQHCRVRKQGAQLFSVG